jgi:GGDEF domain-containing protein
VPSASTGGSTITRDVLKHHATADDLMRDPTLMPAKGAEPVAHLGSRRNLTPEYWDLFDAETGLPGPGLLRDRLDVALRRARRLENFVLVIDLEVDDCGRGSSRSAAAVSSLAESLQSALRVDDTVARAGERELVIVCNDLVSVNDAQLIIDRILDDAQRPLQPLGGDTSRIFWAGFALSKTEQDAEALLGEARWTHWD